MYNVVSCLVAAYTMLFVVSWLQIYNVVHLLVRILNCTKCTHFRHSSTVLRVELSEALHDLLKQYQKQQTDPRLYISMTLVTFKKYSQLGLSLL
jgi:hypothetical protein